MRLPQEVVDQLAIVKAAVRAPNARHASHTVHVGNDVYEVYAYVQGGQISWGVNGPPHGFNVARGLVPK